MHAHHQLFLLGRGPKGYAGWSLSLGAMPNALSVHYMFQQILENIKMRKAKGKETKTEQGIVGNIKMGKPEGKETNQKKE